MSGCNKRDRFRRHRFRRGFSIVELLVVGSVIFILTATLLPAFVQARHAARRTHCMNNLRQIALALDHYHNDFNMFPPGCVDESGPVPSAPVGYQVGWIVQLLPKLEQSNLYQTLDFSRSIHDVVNAAPNPVQISALMCPTDHPDTSLIAVSSYAGCVGGPDRLIDVDNSGVLFLNSSISRRQVFDGLSNTIVLGETRFHNGLAKAGLGWMSGSASTLRSTAWPINGEFVDTMSDECGGFGSYHGGFAMFQFADGSTRPLTTAIDALTLQYLGDREDGALISTRTEDDDARDHRRAAGIQEQLTRRAEKEAGQ